MLYPPSHTATFALRPLIT